MSVLNERTEKEHRTEQCKWKWEFLGCEGTELFPTSIVIIASIRLTIVNSYRCLTFKNLNLKVSQHLCLVLTPCPIKIVTIFKAHIRSFTLPPSYGRLDNISTLISDFEEICITEIRRTGHSE